MTDDKPKPAKAALHHGGSATAALARLNMALTSAAMEAKPERRPELEGNSHPDVEQAIVAKRFQAGGTMTAADGTNYTIAKVVTYRNGAPRGITLERTVPKLKGKAAKKAHKKARRLAREGATR